MGSLETRPELASNRPELSPHEERRRAWLAELANFIVEANRETWAAEKGKVEPQRPGFKEMEYRRGDWRLRDGYTGYFVAPGMTDVYYKNTPVWTMAYGGDGFVGKSVDVKECFSFLKAALMKVTPELPYRGPRNFSNGEREYKMKVTGYITSFEGEEKIFNGKYLEFQQKFFGGIVVNKNSSRKPVYPWNLCQLPSVRQELGNMTLEISKVEGVFRRIHKRESEWVEEEQRKHDMYHSTSLSATDISLDEALQARKNVRAVVEELARNLGIDLNPKP